MILMACVDGRNGMAFNCRRQSRDRAVRADLLAEAGGGLPLGEWGHGSPVPGGGAEPPLCGRVVFGKGGARSPALWRTALWRPFAGRVERVVLYRWDRAYPADLYWDLSLEGWTLARQEEFPGFSHEIITKEVYIP